MLSYFETTGYLLVSAGLGARRFGFLAFPYERDCQVLGVPLEPLESQTTGPQTTNENTFRMLNIQNRWGPKLGPKRTNVTTIKPLGWIWVLPKMVGLQNGWFVMENPIKMDDLGGKPTIFKNTHFEDWNKKQKVFWKGWTLFLFFHVDEDRVTWAVKKHPLFHDTIITGWLLGVLIVKKLSIVINRVHINPQQENKQTNKHSVFLLSYLTWTKRHHNSSFFFTKKHLRRSCRSTSHDKFPEAEAVASDNAQAVATPASLSDSANLSEILIQHIS